MGNQHSASHIYNKPRKNVHWKSAGRPAIPGKPEIIPLTSDDEPNAITLRWAPPVHDGGAPLQGYQVECQRLGSAAWIRTAPPIVLRPELVLTGLEPPHRYQFRVAAVNAVGRSDHSPLSDVLNVTSDKSLNEPPVFLQHLTDVTALENDKTEFRVSFIGTPSPTVAWFKDGYEIFSSRRTAITTDESTSILVFHQTLPTDEGDIKCTATNRAGHAVTKAKLILEAAPKLRYPRQYEDGLLYEINETVFLKTSIVGKPTPMIEWRHNGQLISPSERVEFVNTPKFSALKIHSAQRTDRGEYQIQAKNEIGEDTASFLVTVTAPPDPPQRVSVTRQVDKSITLTWEPPEDDGGCRIGNYVVEYYRTGWNVWLKATTSRKLNVTLFDLIEGSEYRFRVKAESPYGMSSPSAESPPVKIPGRSVDIEFLAVESRIINDVILKEDGEEVPISPVPRRRKTQAHTTAGTLRSAGSDNIARGHGGSNEFMLVLCPETDVKVDTVDKRKSFQLDLEDALSPPQLSLSAPDLSTRCVLPFKALRNAVSSTELLHERAMARFYKAVAMKEEQNAIKEVQTYSARDTESSKLRDISPAPVIKISPKQSYELKTPDNIAYTAPEIIIKADSFEDKSLEQRQYSIETETTDKGWQSLSFEEDYTASTVTTDEEFSDQGSINGDSEQRTHIEEEDTYHPRNKPVRPSPVPESAEEDVSETDFIKQTPLPDPNFIPKPILKRRESNPIESKPEQLEDISKTNTPKKEEKLNILKKITKMPVQKPFSFSKILSKKEPIKTEEIVIEEETPPKPTSVQPKLEKTLSEEGRTAIDYYSNIVKEYGGQKKPTTQLYLKTEELKSVAEKQLQETQQKRAEKIKTSRDNKNKNTKKVLAAKTSTPLQNNKTKEPTDTNNHVGNNTQKEKPLKLPTQPEKMPSKQIILKTAQRASIVIPIDYQEMEQKAKVNVRSAIDYMVDVCLLLIAFWVYFFKDERLAIPFLVLIIYRQLQETLLFNIPEWIRQHTPGWLKKKTS